MVTTEHLINVVLLSCSSSSVGLLAIAGHTPGLGTADAALIDSWYVVYGVFLMYLTLLYANPGNM
jgi:hypothetical protein